MARGWQHTESRADSPDALRIIFPAVRQLAALFAFFLPCCYWKRLLLFKKIRIYRKNQQRILIISSWMTDSKDGQIDQKNRMGIGVNQKHTMLFNSSVFNEGVKSVQCRKRRHFNKWCWNHSMDSTSLSMVAHATTSTQKAEVWSSWLWGQRELLQVWKKGWGRTSASIPTHTKKTTTKES